MQDLTAQASADPPRADEESANASGVLGRLHLEHGHVGDPCDLDGGLRAHGLRGGCRAPQPGHVRKNLESEAFIEADESTSVGQCDRNISRTVQVGNYPVHACSRNAPTPKLRVSDDIQDLNDVRIAADASEANQARVRLDRADIVLANLEHLGRVSGIPSCVSVPPDDTVQLVELRDINVSVLDEGDS